MRRTMLLAVLALGACGGGDAGDATAPASTDLRIEVFPSGAGGASIKWELRCASPGGSLPQPEQACERLAELGQGAFEPVPDDAMCTEQYGGPQVATIEGVLDGRPISARFARTNGCEIERWDRLRFLFPET